MEFINVLDNRGVYGDGIHDDTKALQNCIDTLKSGGTIYFPDGVYLLSATLRVTSNAFIAPEETNSPAMGIITENPDTASLTEEDNVFIGHFDEKLVYGIR